MATTSRKNLYAGVNAHLQLMLPVNDDPSPSMFPAFHSDHITYLTARLNSILPDHYIASTEQSLQIRTTDFDNEQKWRGPEPDVGIYQQSSPVGTSAWGHSALAITEPTLELEFEPEFIDPDRILPSVVIHEHHHLGRAVTRLELLSLGNKWGGSGYQAYMQNRSHALQSGTHLVEIDYFHTSPSPIMTLLNLPVYPHPEAHPYNIIVSITGRKIHTRIYGVEVDQSLPTALPIPLLNNEQVCLDVQATYNEAFVNGRWGQLLNYEQALAPHDLATFRPDDQTRLEALRATILEMVK
jgi:hypothetical protein